MNVGQLAVLLNSIVFLIIGVGVFTLLVKLGTMIERVDKMAFSSSDQPCHIPDGYELEKLKEKDSD